MTFFVKGVKVKIGFLFSAVITLLLCFRVNSIVIISVVSAILHESGHIASMIYSGEYPQQITFGLFGLSVIRGNDIKLNYNKEIFNAFCGPLVNIIIVLILLPFLFQKKSEMILNIVSVNSTLAIFNLLPVFGLDGGRITENFLLKKCSVKKTELIVRILSVTIIIPIMAVGFLILLKSGYNFTLFLLSIYLCFLLYFRCR